MRVSDDYRARANECFRLAEDASTKHERGRYFDVALTLLRAATHHDDALPTLPLAAGLGCVLADRTLGQNSSKDTLREILNAIPRGSSIAFNIDQLTTLVSVDETPGAGAKVEDLGRACGCSLSLSRNIAVFTKKP
jgi:hypothetical protein